MAITIVQSVGSIANNTGYSLSFANNVTPGNAIIALCYNPQNTSFSVSDGGSDSFTGIAASHSSASGQEMFYCQSSVGGFKTVTMASGGVSAENFFQIFEVSGLLSSGTLVDASATANNLTTTTPTTTTTGITTTSAGDLIMVFDPMGTFNTTAVASPYTLFPSFDGMYMGAYYIPTGTVTGSQAVFSTSSGDSHSTSVVAFIAAPPPPPKVLPFPWMETTGNMQDMTGGMRN